jgi:HD-like signal output (HDOD) protein
MHLEKLFLQPRALPAIPRVMQELIASFQDEGVAVKHLADLISTDQVITANLLRMANSRRGNQSSDAVDQIHRREV